jgi:hypothetical protein
MRPNESGITRASISHTIGSLNDLRIFVARSSTDSITCDTIRKRSKACSIPFFEVDVELFMRGYIVSLNVSDSWFNPLAQLDLKTGRITRLAGDGVSDLHSAAWTRDGGIVASRMGLVSRIWKFTPQDK